VFSEVLGELPGGTGALSETARGAAWENVGVVEGRCATLWVERERPIRDGEEEGREERGARRLVEWRL